MLQAAASVRYLEAVGAASGGSIAGSIGESYGKHILVWAYILMLVAASASLMILAWWGWSAGLGSGFGVVLVGLNVLPAARRLWMLPWRDSPVVGLLSIAALSVLLAAWVWLLRGPRLAASDVPLARLPLPLGGVVPLLRARVGRARAADQPHGRVELARGLSADCRSGRAEPHLAVLLVASPAEVRRAQVERVPRGPRAGAAALREIFAAAWGELLPVAVVLSSLPVLAVVLMAWLPLVLNARLAGPTVAELAFAAAVGLDVLAEHRARRRAALRSVWTLSSVHDAEPVLRLLREAGMEGAVRGGALFALCQVLGAFALPEVLVPPQKVDARALLERALSTRPEGGARCGCSAPARRGLAADGGAGVLHAAGGGVRRLYRCSCCWPW